MTGFGENVQKPEFFHLIPLNPQIMIFTKYGTTLNDVPYCTLPSCKKLETFNDQFLRKWPKTWIFSVFRISKEPTKNMFEW